MTRTAAVFCAGLFLVTAMAAAAKDLDPAEVEAARKAGKILPEEDVVQRAQAKRAGKVSAVELERKYGRYVYEVHIVDDAGAKWEVKLDAKTGAVMSNKPEQSDQDAADDDD